MFCVSFYLAGLCQNSTQATLAKKLRQASLEPKSVHKVCVRLQKWKKKEGTQHTGHISPQAK